MADFPYTYFYDHPSVLSTTRAVIADRLPRGQRLTIEEAQALIDADPPEDPPAAPVITEVQLVGAPAPGSVPTWRSGRWVPEVPGVEEGGSAGVTTEELDTAIATRQAAATAATDAELASAIATVNAAIAAKQNTSSAATDAELATAVAALEGVLDAKADAVDVDADIAAAVAAHAAGDATDAELAAAVASLTSAIALKQDAATAATDAELAAAIAALKLDPADFADGQIPVWDSVSGEFRPEPVGRDIHRVVTTTLLTVSGVGSVNAAPLKTAGNVEPFSNFNFTMPDYPVYVEYFSPSVLNATVDKGTNAAIQKQDGTQGLTASTVMSPVASFGGAMLLRALLDNTDYAAGAAVSLRIVGWVSTGGGVGTFGSPGYKQIMRAYPA